jgi:hypothetical protein
MRTSYAGWVVAGVLLVLICTVGAMQQQGQVGRWQLVIGEWENKDGARQCVAVAVDTTTGWTYWREVKQLGWNPVPSPTPARVP